MKTVTTMLAVLAVASFASQGASRAQPIPGRYVAVLKRVRAMYSVCPGLCPPNTA